MQINIYGKTKEIAEKKILDISSDFSILRVPVLYGIRAGLKASALLSGAINALNSDNTFKMDNCITRYPTYTGDVAKAALLLLNKNAKGIYHFSGQDKTTKYGVAETISVLISKNLTNIIKMDIPPNDDARRPLDSHLSMDKILELGLEMPMPFKHRVEQLLKEVSHQLP